MTIHIITEADGYCEDCGQPVRDGIDGSVDRELGIAVCTVCHEDGWLLDLEEIHADLDAMYGRREWEAAQMVADDMPAPGMF